MTLGDKPTFTIVESHYTDDVDYDEFRKDFLDPSTRVPDLKKKYSLSYRDYKNLSSKVCKEENIEKKPTSYKNYNLPKVLDTYGTTKYIQVTRGNKFRIYNANNTRKRYCGTYDDLETAMKIRDKMVESNWDEDVIVELMDEYSNNNWNTAYNDAKRLYPVFKEHYFKDKDNIIDVNKKLGVRRSVYPILRRMIKDEYGIRSRPRVRGGLE